MTKIDTSDTRPSVIFFDTKFEGGTTLTPYMKSIGMTILSVNPTAKFADIMPPVNVNFWHHIFDAMWSDNPAHMRSVIPMVMETIKSLVPEPPRVDTEAAQFFLAGYRAIAVIYLLSTIADRRVPYPSELWELVANPKSFLGRLKEVAARPLRMTSTRGKIEAYAISKARTYLNTIQTKGLERYFEEFRAGMERHSSIYNSASHLGNYGIKDSIPLTILREKACFMTISTPLAYLEEYAPFQEMFVRSIFTMAKLTAGRTIYIMAEEAGATLPKGIERELTTMRGLNLKMDTIWQFDKQFSLKAGEDGQRTLDSQMDVEILSGISRSDDDTHTRISKRFGQTTEAVTSQNSHPGQSAGTVNVNRQVKDVITPAQVAETPMNKQFVFISNARGDNVKQPKTIIDKVHYGQVLPHRDVVAFNPVENKQPLYSGDIAIALEYERDKEPRFKNMPDVDAIDTQAASTVENEPFLTPFSMLWLPTLIVIIAAFEIFSDFSLLPF